MPKIKLEREKCIGCSSCQAVCPKYFELIDDGKSHIKTAQTVPTGGTEELDIEKIECAETAAEVCPTQCIHIEK